MRFQSIAIEEQYAAIFKRDAYYDDLFFFAVTTTGIYCRPSCPAPRPLKTHVVFYNTAREAQAAGFRPCKRCRPNEPTFKRTRAILDSLQTTSGHNLEEIAAAFAISSRHLRRITKHAAGGTPSNIKHGWRLAQALQLLRETNLPIADIAFRADFSSVSQFNRVFKTIVNTTPREFRQAAQTVTKYKGEKI